MLAIMEKLVIVEPMNTKQGKRVGRPRGPEKVLFRARVTREEGSALGILLENLKKGTEWSMKAVPLDSKASGASGGVGVGGNGESGLKGQEKLDAIILSQSEEIAKLQQKIEEFEARALEPQSDNAVYWKGKYLEVAEKLRAVERMREG